MLILPMLPRAMHPPHLRSASRSATTIVSSTQPKQTASARRQRQNVPGIRIVIILLRMKDATRRSMTKASVVFRPELGKRRSYGTSKWRTRIQARKMPRASRRVVKRLRMSGRGQARSSSTREPCGGVLHATKTVLTTVLVQAPPTREPPTKYRTPWKDNLQ